MNALVARSAGRWAATAALGLMGPVTAAPPPDFNGDGVADLVVAVPGEDVGTATNAGAVNVMYGSAGGVTPSGAQFWNQDSPGIDDVAEANDRFGASVAWGDFDGDGFSDLAIGAPFENIDSIPDAGAVNVLYGSATGLVTAGSEFWHQDEPGIVDSAESGDQFGWALIAGDFNDDGFDDLAIGIIGEDLDLAPDCGAVQVLYGSTSGLRSFGDEIWHQNRGGIDDRCEAGDQFGSALAVGDFNGDGVDDLAIGVPSEDAGTFPSGQEMVGVIPNVGAVNIIYGTPGGLSASGDQFWNEHSSGISGTPDIGDVFGFALAAGDFDGDGRDDLAIGVPLKDFGSLFDVGVVHVLYGNSTGLSSLRAQLWSQNSPNIAGTSAARDRFGISLAAGDFDEDGRADLAIGAPGEFVGGLSAAGAVNVIYGADNGLRAARNRVISQDSSGIANTAELGDRFGETLMAADFDGDGRSDLAVGAPREEIGSVIDAGAVNLIFGSLGGLKARNQFWHQNRAGVSDDSEQGDQFGGALR